MERGGSLLLLPRFAVSRRSCCGLPYFDDGEACLPIIFCYCDSHLWLLGLLQSHGF